MTYSVQRQFQYNQKMYHPGDEWKPGGFKHDDKLIEQEFVKEEIIEFYCQECEREFKSKSGLMSHRRAKHDG